MAGEQLQTEQEMSPEVVAALSEFPPITSFLQ
jgi:hypothetical protein